MPEGVVASMRFAPAAVLLALLAAAPPALGQVTSPLFDLEALYESGPVEPGNKTTVAFTLTRLCRSPAAVHPEQTLEARFTVPPSVASVAGPMQVAFPQQPCATEPRQVREASYEVRLLANATHGSVVEMVATFQPLPAGGGPTLASPGPAVSHALAFEVAEAPAVASAGSVPPDLEAPALPSLLLAAALLAAAVALRRR